MTKHEEAKADGLYCEVGAETNIPGHGGPTRYLVGALTMQDGKDETVQVIEFECESEEAACSLRDAIVAADARFKCPLWEQIDMSR